jgi:hypothetical protein
MAPRYLQWEWGAWMIGDDTGGDVWADAGAWSGMACRGGLASGKFFNLPIEGGGNGLVAGGECSGRDPGDRLAYSP